MAAPSSTAATTIPRRPAFTFLALAWLTAVNLRSVLLAVPPVLPQIQHDLGLTYTATSLLTSLPTLMMGLAAVPGAFLVARSSARSAIAVGLGLLAAGTLLRAVVPAALPLYTFTIVLSLGIAVSQPALPVLVRQWFPRQIGLATGIFSNGFIIGEVLAAVFTTPVLLWLGTTDWRVSFLFWGVPVVATLILWLLFAPHASSGGVVQGIASWRAGWNTWRGWRMGLLLGSGSLVYFAMNTWIPEYDKALGRGTAYHDALSVLNAMQLPTSILVTIFASYLAGRRWPFIFCGVLCTTGIFGWLFAPVSTALLWAGLLGAGSSGVFLLSLALPPLLAPKHEEVAGYSGLLLTLGYTSAFFGPLIGGGLWDLSGIPGLAFLPVIVASVMQFVLGAILPRPAREETTESAAATN